MEITDKYHSHFHKFNDENLRVCVSKLEMGKLLVFPSNSTYIIGVNALNKESIDYLKEITKTNDEELIMFGLSWDLLRLLFPISNELYNKVIIRIIITPSHL
jgi:tRNA A37 threonylcarbamoyladenosine synthetase subunit TsaC/SUA5/YrdC